MKNKLEAQKDWSAMITNSWTYNRLTAEERNRLWDKLNGEETQNIISGTYKQRWEILGALYSMFLEGCGYKPIGWREELSTTSTFYEIDYKRYGKQAEPLRSTDKERVLKFAEKARADEANKDIKILKVDIISTEIKKY